MIPRRSPRSVMPIFHKSSILRADGDAMGIIEQARKELNRSMWGPELLQFCKDHNIKFVQRADYKGAPAALYAPSYNYIECYEKLRGVTLGHEIRHGQQFRELLKGTSIPLNLRHRLALSAVI